MQKYITSRKIVKIRHFIFKYKSEIRALEKF